MADTPSKADAKRQQKRDLASFKFFQKIIDRDPPFTPRRDIPITVTVDGHPVRAWIVLLSPSDIIVRLYRGRKTATRHVMAIAMGWEPNRLAKFEGRVTTDISPHGYEVAESLVRELLGRPPKGRPTE